MKRYALLCAAVVAMALSSHAQGVASFSMPSARMSALGGPHAASVSGVDAIFENPAGFVAEETEFSFGAIVVNPAGPVFDMAGLMLSGGDLLTGAAGLFDDSGRLYFQADLLGPLSFAYAGKGLGFGLFNRTVATVNAASLFNVAYSASEEIMLAGGYAYRFALGDGHTIDLGIMPKSFIRASVGDVASLTDIMALVSDPGSLLASPLTMVSGVGFDAGVQWTYRRSLTVGFVAHDAYSPAMVTTYDSYEAFADSPSSGVSAYAVVPAVLSVGAAYDVPWPLLGRLGADLLVLVDYTDLLDLFSALPRNPILNVSFGAELTLLDILSLRAGVKDALPTAGFGIDLSVFTFSLAMYGEELGLEPGSRPVFNLLVAFEFKY